jgi:hypothetical protein
MVEINVQDWHKAKCNSMNRNISDRVLLSTVAHACGSCLLPGQQLLCFLTWITGYDGLTTFVASKCGGGVFRRRNKLITQDEASRSCIMSLSPEEADLRDRFLKVLLDSAIRLQPGDDPEVTLEALVEASQLLTDHLQHELAAIRQEQD